jgi:hypothetical protein
MLLAAYLRALGQYSEATAALMKAHFQVMLIDFASECSCNTCPISCLLT